MASNHEIIVRVGYGVPCVGCSSTAEHKFVALAMGVRFSSATPVWLHSTTASARPCHGQDRVSTTRGVAIFLLSSSVEQVPVKNKAVGSTPTVGATQTMWYTINMSNTFEQQEAGTTALCEAA